LIPNKSNQISDLIDDNSKFNSIIYEPVLESRQVEKPSKIVDSITNNLVKPVPSRIDYNFYNYCSICELKYPKQILRCKDCKQKVRTRPWHRSKIVDRKRI
jgi:hypothetical protein